MVKQFKWSDGSLSFKYRSFSAHQTETGLHFAMSSTLCDANQNELEAINDLVITLENNVFNFRGQVSYSLVFTI